MSKIIYLAWLFPFVEALFMVYGMHHAHGCKPAVGDGGATEAIIQITTIGNHETVNLIAGQIRAYGLPFAYQLWVVVEPWTEPGYAWADEVIVVPEDFTCQSTHKGRALEYSRRLRAERGLNRHDVKIIFVDDDTLPTRQYFVDAFHADYDVCEGITTPRMGYGRLLSHMDDLRTLSCMVICSTFQGHGHPVWVHGEGLTMRGSAEETVTWDFPIIASEDLVFGQNAVALGLKWGFLWEYVQLTSPWTWRDFVKQRRRWLWGNIHALQNGLIPPFAGAMVAGRYLLGLIVFVVSLLGIALVPAGVVHIPAVLATPLLASMGVWLAGFAVACWLATGRREKGLAGRLLDVVVGVLLAIVTSTATVVVLFIALAMGKPTKFEVIQKTKPVAGELVGTTGRR